MRGDRERYEEAVSLLKILWDSGFTGVLKDDDAVAIQEVIWEFEDLKEGDDV